ncbi:proteasome subunit [Roridomyces roridus]|uniref:Proteasome subunit beta n=1 Tax=Roridomyces roridus TaxID=1738132 RepID=A0AAD7FYM7_9AGAR|nr:proteasome subunit [Roridomyces roridus]
MAFLQSQSTHAALPLQLQNGGTILAVAGSGFSVVAGDILRQSNGYTAQAPTAPKVFRLTDKAVLATNGFASDGNMFVKKVRQRLEWYRHAHSQDMSLHAIARLIQSMLYQRRFFPFYVSNILGGIEDDGSGAVYSFDAVGSYERETCRVAGAAAALVQPFLDSQMRHKPSHGQRSTGTASPPPTTHLPLSRVVSLVMEAFTGAAERHAEVGDGLEIYVVLDKGAPLQGLENLPGVTELTDTKHASGQERMFVVRRSLKRD